MKFWEPFEEYTEAEEPKKKPYSAVIITVTDLDGDKSQSKKNFATHESMKELIESELDLEKYRKESESDNELPGIMGVIEFTANKGDGKVIRHELKVVSKDLSTIEIVSWTADDEDILDENYRNVRDVKRIAETIRKIAGA